MEKSVEISEQLQLYYSLWKESNVIYEEWAKSQGLSSNSLLILESFYYDGDQCTQKSISQKWMIPKQTINTILKEFESKGYVEFHSLPEDKRNKLIQLTSKGREFTETIISRLLEKEKYVVEQMGLENIKNMNNNLMLFIKFFREENPGENK
jgi:DNA-binding MarR family transcriptional regulator